MADRVGNSFPKGDPSEKETALKEQTQGKTPPKVCYRVFVY